MFRAMSATSTWELTGNHELALPCIARRDGSIHRANVLHAESSGIIEWAGALDLEQEASPGAALLGPRVRIDGEPTAPDALAWERVDRWIPGYRAALAGGLELEALLCAVPGLARPYPGAVYRFRVHNRGGESRQVEVALEGRWSWSLRRILEDRPLRGENRVVSDRHAPALALETPAGPTLAVLVAGATPMVAASAADEGGGAPAEIAAGQALTAANGTPLRLRLAAAGQVGPGRSAEIAFFLAAAPEPDGALAAARYLAEQGSEELIRLARLELAGLVRSMEGRGRGGIFNRNLLFNFFFALARGIDDARLYPLGSRSPLLAGGGAFREREALLWTLPALTLAEPHFARELLLRCFELCAHQPGERSRYVDGAVVEPGFALDQACAYVLALDRYVRETGDETVVDEPLVQEVLRELDARLMERLHARAMLSATEYLPSGERATHPFTGYGNALLSATCSALERVWRRHEGEAPSNLAGAQEDVADAVWRHCTAEVDGLRVLAFATDVEGEAVVYDDPAGSLAMLPFLGFCDADDPIWSNTMELLRSPEYPFWIGEARFPGVSSRARPGAASLIALCADLLTPRAGEALEVLGRLELEGDVAAAAYDPETGRSADGAHHAAAAGFLAWALWSTRERR